MKKYVKFNGGFSSELHQYMESHNSLIKPSSGVITSSGKETKELRSLHTALYMGNTLSSVQIHI